jgi:two-component system, chemotaxis family, protein-glutamate methylesterase/glutaminase
MNGLWGYADSVAADGAPDRPAEPNDGDRYDILAVTSSAGGVSALRDLLSSLPADFPIPVLIVQHLDPRHESVLAEVIGRRTPLQVKMAESDESVKPGVVYVAPPDRHLLVNAQGTLTLAHSALVHFVRPSADLLFESVAGAYGPRVLACVLTGTGGDGAMGISAVKARGGTVIAEDPATADFAGMPDAAIKTGNVDFVLPLDEIPDVIIGLVRRGRAG